MPQPVPYRNVFLFVSGRTPQILTETLFFFLVQHKPPVRPHEIHVLTTSEGRELIRTQLLATGGGQFYSFCQEYGLDPASVRFSARTVEVLRDERGSPLADIRTNADNRAAADQIVAKVKELTSDPHTRLLASLAGGRKTMGLYLGFALQFYGRPQDRLTHVLVNPPELENNPQFFYPSARRSGLQGAATVTVAEVPLVLLGHKLPVLRERTDLQFAALVAQSQREVDLLTTPLPLTIDRLGRQLKVGDTVIRLSGLEFALYCLTARTRLQAACASSCSGCRLCTLGAVDFLHPQTIAAVEAIAAELGIRDRRLQELRWWTQAEAGKQRFLQVCARIKRKIQAVLGAGGTPYTIAPLPTRLERAARYTIALDKRLLRMT